MGIIFFSKTFAVLMGFLGYMTFISVFSAKYIQYKTLHL